MTTQNTKAHSGPPPSAGFWNMRHVVIGLGIVSVLVVLMVRACGDDEPEKRVDEKNGDMPRQAIVVQIPASQWPTQPAQLQPPAPQQPGYGYIPQQQFVQPQVPAPDGSNPWAAPRQSNSQSYSSYGQSRAPEWGEQLQPQRPQYAQPATGGARYRPLEPEDDSRREPPPQQPVQGYYPVAPYDRLSGSSFGTPAYPYGGAYGSYPGYGYGSGLYGLPGSGYGLGWPHSVPGVGWLPGR